MKSIELFKARNFDFVSNPADVTNAIFNSWLKSAVRVYGFPIYAADTSGERLWSANEKTYDDKASRIALLVCIEELPKK